ncbi:MAG TPA: FAD-binding oxidoreductase [Candidatus Binataceae bacterium]|nr:FAD-binding oxidoreductase [Candidatus Binataceae bacterium]
MERYDFIVVGAGIAGASAGFALSADARVLLIERESQPGYHSTGRSAALYVQTHGPAVVRTITRASKSFFMNPPDGFAEGPLLTPRGIMFIGRADQSDQLERCIEESARTVGAVRRITGPQAHAMVPVLREDYVAGAVLDPEAMDIDVHAVHYGYLRGLRSRGGAIVTAAELHGLDYRDGVWTASTAAGEFSAPVIVNAAGAWCDKVAALAGARAVGLVPKRRTAFIFDPPALADIREWPSIHDVGETFYFKPDAGRILASPADETPMEPSDVQPDDLDVAIAAERIQAAALLPIRHIIRRWAGLRSFVADGVPVVGYDPAVAGFFWLAGQGGYGIETSPTMGRLCASLATGRGIPPDLADLGVEERLLSPSRFAT